MKSGKSSMVPPSTPIPEREPTRSHSPERRNPPIVIPAQAGIHYNTLVPHQYYVYILTSKPNGTLYIGMTNNLARRVWEHKQGLVEGFTKKYGARRPVYAESFARPRDAIEREKRFKKWNRAWKTRLIESVNPGWKDLSETVMYMP
jgi:putative endonuclease